MSNDSFPSPTNPPSRSVRLHAYMHVCMQGARKGYLISQLREEKVERARKGRGGESEKGKNVKVDKRVCPAKPSCIR